MTTITITRMSSEEAKGSDARTIATLDGSDLRAVEETRDEAVGKLILTHPSILDDNARARLERSIGTLVCAGEPMYGVDVRQS